jgi:hypothetical protein
LQFTGLERSQIWPRGFARQSPAGRDMRKETEESTVFGAVTMKRLAKTWKTLCVLLYSDLSSVWNRVTVIVTSSCML